MDVIHNERELSEAINRWLQDPALVEKTRSFFGKDALSSFKLAAWTRRGIPQTFKEACILTMAAEATVAEATVIEQAEPTGKCFWQVWVVLTSDQAASGTNPQEGEEVRHDGLVIRMWEQVKGVGSEASFLTPKAWFDGKLNKENEEDEPIRDIVAKKSFGEIKFNEDRDGWIRSEDGQILLTWALDTDEEKTYGYSMSLLEVFAGTKQMYKGRLIEYEYMGGLPTIPVEKMTLFSIIPNTVLRGPVHISPSPPQSFAYNGEGDPVDTIKDVLSGKLPPRYYKTRTREKPAPVEDWDSSGIELPQQIVQELEYRKVLTPKEIQNKEKAGYSILTATISKPRSHWAYGLYFELPDSEKKSGDHREEDRQR